MKTKKVKSKYESWLNTGIMHKDSLKWLSELSLCASQYLKCDVVSDELFEIKKISFNRKSGRCDI